MRYTLEYKLKCIEMYNQGIWPETPKGIKKKNFQIQNILLLTQLDIIIIVMYILDMVQENYL